MNKSNFKIYIQIYIPILYVARMAQKKKRFNKLNTVAWSCC